MNDNQRLGRFGEEEAARFLEEKGFSVVARNYRTVYGEIDIVAETDGPDGREVHFVEVKTRTGSAYGRPMGAITPQKIRHLLSAAAVYAGENGLDCALILDAAEVYARKIGGRTECLRVEFYENISEGAEFPSF